MSNTVNVTVATTPTPFATGTIAAGVVITLSGGIAPQTVAAAPYTATFTGVPAGTYTATAQAVSSTNQMLGSPIVSAEFTVVAGQVNIDIPINVTVALS